MTFNALLHGLCVCTQNEHGLVYQADPFSVHFPDKAAYTFIKHKTAKISNCLTRPQKPDKLHQT